MWDLASIIVGAGHTSCLYLFRQLQEEQDYDSDALDDGDYYDNARPSSGKVSFGSPLIKSAAMCTFWHISVSRKMYGPALEDLHRHAMNLLFCWTGKFFTSTKSWQQLIHRHLD